MKFVAIAFPIGLAAATFTYTLNVTDPAAPCDAPPPAGPSPLADVQAFLETIPLECAWTITAKWVEPTAPKVVDGCITDVVQAFSFPPELTDHGLDFNRFGEVPVGWAAEAFTINFQITAPPPETTATATTVSESGTTATATTVSETETTATATTVSETGTTATATTVSETETTATATTVSETETTATATTVSETETTATATTVSETETTVTATTVSETETTATATTVSETETTTSAAARRLSRAAPCTFNSYTATQAGTPVNCGDTFDKVEDYPTDWVMDDTAEWTTKMTKEATYIVFEPQEGCWEAADGYLPVVGDTSVTNFVLTATYAPETTPTEPETTDSVGQLIAASSILFVAAYLYL